jgi:glycosyltransferase involved in cell wall biosynthesis
VVVIPNGYDPEAMAAAQRQAQGSDQLTIAFAGTVSEWHPIESVLRVFDDFVGTRSGSPLALRFIGVSGRDALEELLRSRFPTLARNVQFTGRLPNDLMALELAKANALLMFNMYAHSGTKVFDYLALQRKIILCYSDDPEATLLKEKHYRLDVPVGTDERVLERIIEETRAGVVVKDAPHLAAVLGDLHREFEETRRIACASVGTELHSRRAHAGRLATLLKERVFEASRNGTRTIRRA